MTRKQQSQLETEIALLREQVGLLRAALDMRHCPQDCECRAADRAGAYWPVTTPVTYYTIPSACWGVGSGGAIPMGTTSHTGWINTSGSNWIGT